MLLLIAAAAASGQALAPTTQDLRAGPVVLGGEWRFRAGDLIAWAQPDLADDDWSLVHPEDVREIPARDWEGVGWFRLRLTLEPSMAGRIVPLRIVETGFSDVYLDGQLVRTSPGSRSGRPGRRREAISLRIPSGGEHEIAVRWQNDRLADLVALGQFHGFTLVLGPLDPLPPTSRLVESDIREQSLFTAVPLVFALLHALLFAFLPSSRSHLYLALTTAAFGSAAYFELELRAPTVADPILATELMRLSLFVVILSSFYLVYTLEGRPPGRALRVATLLVPAVSVAAFFDVRLWYPTLVALVAVALLRMPVSMVRLLQQRRAGAWIAATGVLLMLVGGIGDLLIDVGLFDTLLGTDNPWLYGGLGLLLGLSVYLARDFAATNLELEARLRQVQQLSQEALELERAGHERAIEKRLLEADNRRKTEELEEARQLQLSLLPKRLPQRPGLEIVAAMQTATEVGGDFYDAREGDDGSVTLALGDATGHGARAGLLVAATKGLFQESSGDGAPAESLVRYHRALRGMALGRMHMALLLARLDERRLRVASAAMPAPLVYRASSHVVEELEVAGLPLGAAHDPDYPEVAVRLAEGDAVLLFSDGLPEQRDGDGNELGYEEARRAFAEVASLPALEALERLQAKLSEHAGERPLDDDVTLMLLRIAGDGSS